MAKALVLVEEIEPRILLIRGQKVLIDADLANLYGTTTKKLNQAVKRNRRRFPKDFTFQLNEKEKAEVVTNCDHLAMLKFSPQLPYAFTEHGAIMAASVLNSPRAVEVSVFVVRAFVKLREMLASHKELAHKLAERESGFAGFRWADEGRHFPRRQVAVPEPGQADLCNIAQFIRPKGLNRKPLARSTLCFNAHVCLVGVQIWRCCAGKGCAKCTAKCTAICATIWGSSARSKHGVHPEK